MIELWLGSVKAWAHSGLCHWPKPVAWSSPMLRTQARPASLGQDRAVRAEEQRDPPVTGVLAQAQARTEFNRNEYCFFRLTYFKISLLPFFSISYKFLRIQMNIS